jgi:D-glycero-D-manno-heptose 1,7-bisphosphate phosphatase
MSNRALFLDRDGVINHEIGYLYRAEDVRFVDGIFPLCRTAQKLGYRLIVVTNQSGIARGFYSERDFDKLTAWMSARFNEEGSLLDAVYYCPYHPEHGVGEYRREHPDRKPGSGMLLRGAAAFGLDLTRSILVGDRCSDIAAANAARLRQAFLLAGTEPEGEPACPGHYLGVHGLPEVEAWIKLQG